MSERGVFGVDRDPQIIITEDDFAIFDDWREQFSKLEAYLWLGLRGPTRANYSWLARQWRWENSEAARRYVYRMVGAGLLRLINGRISAVALAHAVPAPVDGNWESLRAAIFSRDGYRCTYCNSDEYLQCDHIHPRAKGGTDVLDNLTTACRSCNASKRDRLLSEWRNGSN